MIKELIALQGEIHINNVEKGFWEKGTEENKGERVMLIVSELGEALEAHRKKKFVTGAFAGGEFSDKGFELFVKDTMQDEMADTVICLLDYCTGFNEPLLVREYRKQSTGNFGNDLLRIVHYCIHAYHANDPGRDWGYALAAIVKFCEWYSVRLMQHVQWKLQYNRTRPHKHGKAY